MSSISKGGEFFPGRVLSRMAKNCSFVTEEETLSKSTPLLLCLII